VCLTRHIRTRHGKDDKIKAVRALPITEQLQYFQQLRKEGIYKQNIELLKEKDSTPKLIQERRHGTASVQMCSKCCGFYQRSSMHRHMKKCSAVCVNTPNEAVTFQAHNADVTGSRGDQFRKEILSNFRNDDIGDLCKTDAMISTVGRILWERSGKKCKRNVMGEMRKLGNLLQVAKAISQKIDFSGHDMLNAANFRIVVEALNTVSTKDDESEKSGLRLSLGYLLKKAARFTKSEFIIDNQQDQVQQRDNFLSLLDCSWGHLFYSAQVAIESNREINLRRPQNLPVEEDVEKLRAYVMSRIHEILNDQYLLFSASEYIELRSLLVCRLTLFNGRRGGEPARLLLSEWRDAESDTWISPDMVEKVIDPLERILISTYKLAYQRGKGSRKMVPILIPNDAVPAIQKLVNRRDDCGIHKDNPYIFATTRSDSGHVEGWQCVNTACIKAGVSDLTKLTATKMRHRVSTFYALQDVPEIERKAFYRHMGHSQAINEAVYQCPPSVLEITKVGRYLTNLDSGNIVASTSTKPSGKCHDYLHGFILVDIKI
jgi:hypothetical protein